jgi:hypothetical protein
MNAPQGLIERIPLYVQDRAPGAKTVSPIQTPPAPTAIPGSRLRSGALAPIVFGLLAVLTLYAGWANRAETDLTAESGIGYVLGIVGGSLMLLQLLYPLRKRMRFMRHLGTVKVWFRTHMMLGIVGPICILYHANFKLGSTNSNVALFCMLVVAGSGLIGRYLYRKIHHGLYGQKASLDELMADEARWKKRLAAILEFSPQMRAQLEAIQTWQPPAREGVLRGSVRTLAFGLRSHWAHARLLVLTRRALRAKARAEGWPRARWIHSREILRRHLGEFFYAARRLAQFSLFERIFSLWHILHMPLFLMLVVSGVVHVIAVHVY